MPRGASLDGLDIRDSLIIFSNVYRDKKPPEVFIAKPSEIRYKKDDINEEHQTTK